MNLASGIVTKPSNLHLPTHYLMSSIQCSTSHMQRCTTSSNYNSSFKTITSSKRIEQYPPVSKAVKLRDAWTEFQGIKDWDGLLDPLDDRLRSEILRYGKFVEAAYCCFDFDTSSLGYATCRYPRESMLSECDLATSGYKVTRNLHATCGAARLPAWTEDRVPRWAATRSAWVGYVAVCTDKCEIARLGRRDVVVAYRGTATCAEWLENMRVALTRLPDDMAHGDRESMVQSGFLSMYTAREGTRRSLQDSIREEIGKILEKYADEPISITVTGHSLGAALAALTAYDIAGEFKHAPLVTVLSFGGPRIGNKNFRSQLEKIGTKVLRIVNSDDPITKVPGFVINEEECRRSKGGEEKKAAAAAAEGMWNWVQKRVEETQWVYAEIGKELRLSSRDCPHLSNGGVATCHDLKTYLQLVDSFVSSNCPLRATAKKVLSRAHHQQQDKQQEILCG
ncbi:hypothetical protein ABFX02_02G142700 [Erythranthe guttata]